MIEDVGLMGLSNSFTKVQWRNLSSFNGLVINGEKKDSELQFNIDDQIEECTFECKCIKQPLCQMLTAGQLNYEHWLCSTAVMC